MSQYPGQYPPRQYPGQQPQQYAQYPQSQFNMSQAVQAYRQRYPTVAGGNRPSPWGTHVPWYSQYYDQCNPTQLMQISGWFTAIDTDKNGTLDVGELGRALAQAQMYYSPETLHKIMNTFDLDRNGTVTLNEFVALYVFQSQVKNAFLQFDTDRSGSIDYNELSQALGMSGIFLPPGAISSVMHKFDPQRTGRLSFEAFTNLNLFLSNLRSYFDVKARTSGIPGKVSLSFDEFVEAASKAAVFM